MSDTDAERGKIMRLIDADELEKEFCHGCQYEHNKYVNCIGCALAQAPTVDAMPVVRCRDCKWGKEACGNIECFVDLNVPTEYHGYDWFCPNGERKDDAAD